MAMFVDYVLGNFSRCFARSSIADELQKGPRIARIVTIQRVKSSCVGGATESAHAEKENLVTTNYKFYSYESFNKFDM